MVHGSIAIPGRTEHDEVVITTEEIAASGLDYLALGHWHSMQTGKAGGVSYAYAGAPEAVALDQDRAGKVLLVELDERGRQAGGHDQRSTGRPDPVREGRDRRGDGRQPAGARRAPRRPRRPGPGARRPADRRPPRRARPRPARDGDVADRLVPQGAPARRLGPGADRRAAALARHDRRGVHPRPGGTDRRARDGRCRRRGRRGTATRSGSAGCCSPAARSRCEGPPAARARLPALSHLRHRLRARPDGRPRPERIGQEHRPARARAGPDATGDEHGRRARVASAVGRAAGGALDHHPRVRAGRGRRPEGRHAREDVRRLEGHRPARLRRPGDHRPDPRRPGHGRADRHPDRGLLPLDSLGPPFRAERPVARRWRAARSPPGLDQRRRPRNQPRAQEARPGAPRPEHPGDRNPGRLKVAEEAVAQAEAALDQGELALDPARTRPRRDGRARATAGPRPSSSLAERRSTAREGPPGRADHGRARCRDGAVRALPAGGRGRRRAPGARLGAPVPQPAAGHPHGRRAPARAGRPDPRAARAARRTRSTSSSTSRPNRPGGRCRGSPWRSSSSACSSPPSRC